MFPGQIITTIQTFAKFLYDCMIENKMCLVHRYQSDIREQSSNSHTIYGILYCTDVAEDRRQYTFKEIVQNNKRLTTLLSFAPEVYDNAVEEYNDDATK